MTHRFFCAATLASLLACAPGLASAQRVGMMAPAESEAAPEQIDALVGRASAALTEAGWTVVPPSDVAAQLRRARVRCAAIDCASRIAAALSLDWAAQVRVWAGLDASVRQIVVTLVSPNGVVREGSADVDATSAEDAVDRAVAGALRRVAGEEDPVPCFVHGTPVGATVVIDGQPAGTLPWSGALLHGTHEVVVSRAGYVTVRRDFPVTSGARVTIELQPEPTAAVGGSGGGGSGHGDSGGGEPRPAAGRDAWPSFVLGGGLLGVGLGLTVPAWIALAQDGQCADRDALGCRGSYSFGASAAAWLIVGGVLAVGGVIVLATQPIAVDVSVSSEGARLGVRGSF